MKFEAVTAGPLSELEQADERKRRMSRPVRRLKNVIEGMEYECLSRVSGKITVLSIVDSSGLIVKFFNAVDTIRDGLVLGLWLIYDAGTSKNFHKVPRSRRS